MKKIISYPITAIYYLIFFLFLCIFHPIQIICLKVFGYQAHKKSVDYLNFFLIKCTNLLGTTYKFENLETIPENVPLIFVANHQSMYDIIAVIWFMRKYHIKFVSKKELGKGVPSVSYNLRNGGSVLIDRKDPKQAIVEISKLSKYIELNKRSALIFPEGTRSKTGVPKKFSETASSIRSKDSLNSLNESSRAMQTTCGTITYMAPEVILNLDKFEQLMGTEENLNETKLYNKKIDIWSYGICLYELIFNTLPFTNLSDMNDLKLFYTKKSNQELIYKNINDKNILSDYIKNILKKMLTIDPINRINIEELDSLDYTTIFIKESIQPKKLNRISSEINMDSWVYEECKDTKDSKNLQDSWEKASSFNLSVDNNFKDWLNKQN